MKFFMGILIYECSLVIADLASDFIQAEIVPDVLDNPPKQLFSFAYDDKNVLFGDEWTPTNVKYCPTAKDWNYDPSSFYTVIMTDIDPPSREKPTYREFLHWLVTNIPGNDFKQGETIVEYAGSGPPKTGGIHRIVFTVYKQPEKLVFDEPYTGNRTLQSRPFFSQRKFSSKYNMGDPVAGNMFVAQFDDYVPTLHAEFLNG